MAIDQKIIDATTGWDFDGPDQALAHVDEIENRNGVCPLLGVQLTKREIANLRKRAEEAREKVDAAHAERFTDDAKWLDERAEDVRKHTTEQLKRARDAVKKAKQGRMDVREMKRLYAELEQEREGIIKVAEMLAQDHERWHQDSAKDPLEFRRERGTLGSLQVLMADIRER